MNSERKRSASLRSKSQSLLVQTNELLGRWCLNWLQIGEAHPLAIQSSGQKHAALSADDGSHLSLSKLGDGLVNTSERGGDLRNSEGVRQEQFGVSEIAVLDDFPVGKRVADIVLIVSCAPLWIPVMAIVAGWIKIVSDGPVFFRQKRVGYGERRFPILKFRSMDAGADTEVHEKHVLELMREGKPLTKLDLQGDSRLIPGGFLMRALGLDELPQLFNVLSGEMSLIGPRPCTPRELSQYDGLQRERFLARPGLTGYWQVNGKNRTTFAEMVALDIDYRRHRSAILDLAILIQTGPALFMQLAEAKAGLTARAVESTDRISTSRGTVLTEDSSYEVRETATEVAQS